MKTSKSPESAEVTPSKKKLKQARLPFKIISEVSPKSATPASRKRKLSTPDDESVTKVGKICKENDIAEDPVIVIDDDSKDGKVTEKAEKLPNPYVRLVDTAWKKKLQKAKRSKKKKISKDNAKVNESTETCKDTAKDNCEAMEVDEPEEKTHITNGADTESNHTIQKETESTVNKSSNEVSDIVILEDSNNASDIAKSESTDVSHRDSSTDTKEEEKIPVTLANSTSDEVEIKENCDAESPGPSDIENNKGSETEDLKAPVTPKRSARNKAKQEENNNSKGSPSSLKLNESMTSNSSTPKQGKSNSGAKLDDSSSGSTPSNNLTPKQLQKKLESAKKREEREKEKQDRGKKRQQEKEERAKQRQEKEDQRKKEREEKEEAKRKEREEKEEQRKKEKEEREKLKELEKKQKEEKEEQKRKEKEEKEEQKRKEREAREEERRKKQEALELEKQELELKKKKEAEAFVSFFVPKQKSDKDQTVGTVSNNMLSSFTLKSDMRLAPTTRTNLSESRANDLVKLITEQNVKEDGLYLKCLKSGLSKPMSSGKTWSRSDKDDDDDVILVEDELPPIDGAGEILTCEPTTREKLRPKLLSFHENRRPPYWGTWRKKSKFVKPRRPFGQDEKQLDYEVDSDEEWEEEQEGESIDGSAAGSDDEQGPDEYEVDNEVFVPHGYLSDEEATMDEDDVLSLSPETQKARLKHLEDEFESEMKKPTEKLKPRLYGLLWENKEGGKPEKCVDAMWNYFGKLAMILNDPTPLLQPSQEPEEVEKKKIKKKKSVTAAVDGEETSQKAEKKKKVKPQEKEGKPPNQENKKNAQEAKKSQPGINMFLTKMKAT